MAYGARGAAHADVGRDRRERSDAASPRHLGADLRAITLGGVRGSMASSDERLLEQALSDLDERPASALALLEALWRATRDPGRGDAFEALAGKVHPRRPLSGKTVSAKSAAWLALDDRRTSADVATLLAALTVGHWGLAQERLARVSAWAPDPRVSGALVALLERPPYASQDAIPFWEDLLTVLVAVDDPRSTAHLAVFAARTWPGSIRAGELMKPLLEEAARAAEGRAPPLPLGEIAARLRDELLRRVAPPSEHARSAERLLARIFDNPEDDELRRVYADVLLEQGDPRGELIALQYRRLDGDLDEAVAKREAWLLRMHRKKWLGPLGDVAADVELERGFLASLSYDAKYAAQLAAVTGSPYWATVRALRLVDTKTKRGLVELLTHPVMRSLRDVRGLDVATAAALGDRGAAWTALGIRVPDAAPPALDLRNFPALRTLEVQSSARGLAPLRWLMEHPVLDRIEALVVQNGDSAFPTWLSAVLRRPRAPRSLVIEPTRDLASGTLRWSLERATGEVRYALSITVPHRPWLSGESARTNAARAIAAVARGLASVPARALERVHVFAEASWIEEHRAELAAALDATRARGELPAVTIGAG